MTLDYRKVTAIVRIDQLGAVEEALRKALVKAISVMGVRGYGERKDFFSPDWMETHARIEVFAGAARAEAIAKAILSAASTGTAGDGIVCVVPVEHVWRIRSRSPAAPEDLA